MSALYGEYSYVMDPKNRMFIPARFREELHKEDKNYFMLSIGLDRCLYLFLPSKWEELIANNMEIFKSENKEEERAFKRFFFGNAADAQLDEQGRILVPQNQKSYASLGKDVIIRGAGNKAEIWDARNWSKYKKTVMEPSFKKFSKIFDL
ncbi:MAG: division/cell wall cluster transcriptional repressor MraZ [Elusimicrobia bacterium GWA2_56_46]|nr:MAG: division/cell wall cluster transcriptional repressor MraZ [Elusimicrobia bacterium GWA2_56_46]OGR55283.1 MAG: division/cell wall cluster transcriptional repressor MraZ [Elusimicrobia bacterium GWC2_56_31]HBB66573.1 division/cell wall cluster transcriptional repressor MraZ [Elusimicrobiota bacterium]HBW23504.1 division/cell wall cluster transcriptional repressor MraZ [Elusimicrobiota bacterium]